ncbi:PREDICTED: uncharacterized protein KIAA1958-like [Amphimedon queenslandica]|uniref:ZMYM2-like/QRICH1 C-terminal domain-containing protein n=1 Tax=Amphimedon queenslandica TaxID=400682 RepID=A0A1X7VSH0_AMPQE|nr:PREDICTED: uncharacterized protein KIAA1958-like [Amphimedon queenslandica]|eukprot:XP_011405518.1 PREDICTED: uncharacterized protein KIAA1958-like [Amphimedon queenslandica]
MKRIKGSGQVHTKQAEPLTIQDEKLLWEKGLLGSGSPHIILDTMVFMCGVYFTLRSRQEHRDLRFSQIKLKEIDGKKCLVFTENTSKNNAGGLKHQKATPKTVTHYENKHDTSKCFIQYYQIYIKHCPPLALEKDSAFYLTPLKKAKGDLWYSCVPVGHNTLRTTMSSVCSLAGIDGFITNHSLRVMAATRLFQACVDEQLIMKRTGHRSIDGVRTYKSVSAAGREITIDTELCRGRARD